MSPHGVQREQWTLRSSLDHDREKHPEWVERSLGEMAEKLHEHGAPGPFERIEADGKIWLVPAHG